MMLRAALPPRPSHNFCAAGVVLPQLVKGDIQSMDLLSFVLQAEEIDTIMHFAAQVRDYTSERLQ
jgi:UDP-glucose 4-epimerase